MSDQTAPTAPEQTKCPACAAGLWKPNCTYGEPEPETFAPLDPTAELERLLEQAEARIDDLLTRLDDRSAALNRTGASNDTLRAQLGRVQKLADEWAGDPVGGDLWRSDAVDDLRAALADQETP